MTFRSMISISFFTLCLQAWAADADSAANSDSSAISKELNEVVVQAGIGLRAQSAISNTEIIGQTQLVRAACCNLGESFSTNPSVDVSYSDAATGARQIKLLGLSGTYVQMLTENVPNLRGAAIPYSLGFVPGPWMQSIQVSKGAASVKNGYESITGQINIEYLKPQAPDGVRGNAYFDSKLRQEVNADAGVHLSDRLSTSLLVHFENRQSEHDANSDGFMDMPRLRQFNAMHRWAYLSPGFISQLSARVLVDNRESGMSAHSHADASIPLYEISVDTKRYEMQWKNALMRNDERNTSLALILHGSIHDADNRFGNTLYDVRQTNGYAQLLWESNLSEAHNLAVGVNLNHDYYKERFGGSAFSLNDTDGALPTHESETTIGGYAQYTFKPNEKWTLMPGIRFDHSSRYGNFVTPRLHVKYSPTQAFTLRASAGKGFRSPHGIAENSQMLACGRTFIIAENLKQEEAWNYGVATNFHLPIADKVLDINAEYYYTHFINQMVMNIDGIAGPNTVSFSNLHGKSYSHTLQIDATYPVFEGFTATGAFRYTDARTTYDTGMLRYRPLTSRYKALLTLSYATPMIIWQFDLTG
ncbi:MAG: TonB-dependent receptor [bacterium]|nr:TonB-dependent receptor [bacterium]